MNDFKFDVDALFGEQVKYDPTSIEKLQYGSRTRPRKTSLTHGKSFTKLIGHHNGMTSNEISIYENTQMYYSELEQIITDKFWGLDKESNDEFYERCEMKDEDDYSFQHELFCKTQHMKKIWENNEIINKKLNKEQNEIIENNAREEYLKTFYSVTNSGDIMNYKWPTRDIFPSTENNNNGNNGNNGNNNNQNGYEIWNLVGEPSTIHLDGLQQSRTISLNGETYDPRKTASIADLAMRPAGTRKNKPSNNSNNNNNNNNTNSLIQQQLSYSSLPHSPHSPHSAHSPSHNNTNGMYALDSPAGNGLVRELSIPSIQPSNHGNHSVISASSPLAGISKLNQPSSHRNKINLLEISNGKYLTGNLYYFLFYFSESTLSHSSLYLF